MATVINGKGTVGVIGGAVVGAPIITQFITTWKTDNAGTSTSTQIRIPTIGTGYACTVDWGDGTSNSYSGTAPVMLHTYPSAGTYTVKISGTFPRISFVNTGDKLKLLTIEYWGTGVWSGSMLNAFNGCANLKINAQDVPNFAGVTNTSAMFQNCTSLTSINVSGWNVSNVTVANNMFYNCAALSSITGTQNWNLSKVTNVNSMFVACNSLSTLDLSGWNLSACTTFGTNQYDGMFYNNTGLKNLNVSNWILNTTSNFGLINIFNGCTNLSAATGFNTWNTSKVTSLYNMFAGCSKLTSLDVSNWNLSACTSLATTFNGCSTLKSINTTGWVLNTGTTYPMNSLFSSCAALTGITGIDNWNVSKVNNTQNMFYGCGSLSSITDFRVWNMSNVTTIEGMFSNCTKLTTLDVSGWNLSACTNISTSEYSPTFGQTGLLNLNVSGWTLPTSTGSSVNMRGMFYNSTSLSAITGLNTWNTSRVYSLRYTFTSTPSLKSVDLTGWNMSNITDTQYMFGTGITGITGSQNWNFSKLTSTSNMFYFSSIVNLDASGWNLSACTNFTNMFITQNLSSLNATGWVLNTSSGATINMTNMFNGSNMPLVSVTGMENWNVSKVSNMSSMFKYCTYFNQNLSNWNLRTSGVTLNNMFEYTAMSTANYTNTIVGWANYVNTNGGSPLSVSMTSQTGRIFQNSLSGGAGFANAGAARSYLTGTLPTGRAWSIAGDTVIA